MARGGRGERGGGAPAEERRCDRSRRGLCPAADRLSQSSPASGMGVRNPAGCSSPAAPPAACAAVGDTTPPLPCDRAGPSAPGPSPPACAGGGEGSRPVRVGRRARGLPPCSASGGGVLPGREGAKSIRRGDPARAAASEARRERGASPAATRRDSSSTAAGPGEPSGESVMLPPDRRMRTAASRACAPPARPPPARSEGRHRQLACSWSIMTQAIGMDCIVWGWSIDELCWRVPHSL